MKEKNLESSICYRCFDTLSVRTNTMQMNLTLSADVFGVVMKNELIALISRRYDK